MTAPPPRRSWWKRKRTLGATALWLGVAYPLSFFPACWLLLRTDAYAHEREWRVIRVVYRPAAVVLMACPDEVRHAVARGTNLAATDGAVFSVDGTGVGIWRQEAVGGRIGPVLYPVW